MTGDDHAATAARPAASTEFAAREPGRLHARPVGVHPRDVVRLSAHDPHERPGRELRVPGLRGGPAPDHGLRRLHAGVARGQLRRADRHLERRSTPSLAAPGHAAHPLHRLERLGRHAEDRAAPRDPARRELLLLAAGLGPGRAGHVHRLGHADALRRHRRVDDRRLPGDDADDRRVRADATRSRSTRCSTARSAPRATTARSTRTCTPTPSARRAPTRSSPRPRRAACPWSPRSRC